jgi:hypothetical protein
MTILKTKFATTNRRLGDPSPEYDSMLTLWERNRAIIQGDAHAKAHDEYIDVIDYKNLLIPFSPKMSQAQYNFYKAEAELPGLIAQYVNIIAAGLLRKPPVIELPAALGEDAEDWIVNEFTSDGGTLMGFLYDLIREELITNRAWVTVDYPYIEDTSRLDKNKTRPYPVLWKAEQVINWRVDKHPMTGMYQLVRFTVRFVDVAYDPETGHGLPIERLIDYFLDDAGECVVQLLRRSDNIEQRVIGGKRIETNKETQTAFEPERAPVKIKVNGQALSFIPAFPANGSADVITPILQPLIDREVALYNKVSRRNHLLLGAGTYTPYICSDMNDEDFARIVEAGLGSWLKLQEGDEVGVLEPPTAALSDYDKAITSTIDEMTRMGIRILAPDTAESGIALELRNASQTAQLNALNTRISDTMERIISLMLNWQYGGNPEEIVMDFKLSEDFNPAPLGSEWLQMVSDWYQNRLIPRSAFISLAKRNDLLPEDYDDEEASQEIEQDSLVPSMEDELALQQQYQTAPSGTYSGDK